MLGCLAQAPKVPLNSLMLHGDKDPTERREKRKSVFNASPLPLPLPLVKSNTFYIPYLELYESSAAASLKLGFSHSARIQSNSLLAFLTRSQVD